ncbi:helix-turn-helix domain-containing protein [Paenibacillus tarimensis]|uniref:helix-turn-helix domain-containing protein n=1 Tax=Paenibacillus tarimensis TaxID=416012 RepID=UPI001F361114|nr:MerR family transcriptional regulator [Paenibacillus tarimensis]MCF2945532.1 MerR family transcriptional regulator [Paenibacillus tarimensis]
MQGKMTIQAFSDRTGLPASTLRYYEKEGLLSPDIRADNGYRLYAESQIPRAIKLHSLRQAGISLTELRAYMSADRSGQDEWLEKWRHDIDSRLKTLQAAKQFMYGIKGQDEQIRLVKWDSPVQMVWFRRRVERKLNPFAQAIDEGAALLSSWSLLHTREAFVRHIQMDGNEMAGSIGYRLRGRYAIPDDLYKAGAFEEAVEPALFVSLDCLANDPYACFSHMLVLQSFGFDPAGPHMERYQLNDKLHYEVMIPVAYMARKP